MQLSFIKIITFKQVQIFLLKHKRNNKPVKFYAIFSSSLKLIRYNNSTQLLQLSISKLLFYLDTSQKLLLKHKNPKKS